MIGHGGQSSHILEVGRGSQGGEDGVGGLVAGRGHSGYMSYIHGEA